MYAIYYPNSGAKVLVMIASEAVQTPWADSLLPDHVWLVDADGVPVGEMFPVSPNRLTAGFDTLPDLEAENISVQPVWVPPPVCGTLS